jgi:tRNA(Ile)-lysidine synthase
MPTTSGDPVTLVRAAVQRFAAMLGPGLYSVACSGGADSMALADAACATWGAAHVVVITVDHGLSAGSARIAAEVAAWARARGAGAVVRRVVVAPGASVEAAARDARYAALDAVAREIGSEWVLLAHTARDQAETVMMRLVRGTGPAGLAGIPQMRGRYVRPLLELPRDEIDAYVTARGLPTWHDPMNDDPRIARVRFRTGVMPVLRAENPAVDQALCRLAMAAREWTSVIDEAAELFARFPIDCVGLTVIEPAVRKRAFALALEAEGLGYDATHLEQIDDLVRGPSRGELGVDIRGGRVVRRYDELSLLRPEPADRSDLRPLPGYELRSWRPGDRMRPARLKGRSRKLSDLFIDAKVPRASRAGARVLVRASDRVIVWAEHLGLAFGERAELVPTRSAGTF